MTFASVFGRTFSPTFQPSSQAKASSGISAPTDITGCALWLDFADVNSMFTDDGSTNVSSSGDKIYRVNDKSGNANHAKNTGTDTTRPTYLPNTQNGKSVGRFVNSSFQHIYWTRLTTIRTVFWVLKDNVPSGYAFVLCDWDGNGGGGTYYFARDTDQDWWASYAHANVINGTTKVNGSVIDGRTTKVPTSLAIASLVTAGNTIANDFGRDRNYDTTGTRHFGSYLGELIIYSTALTSAEVISVETYLNNKWAIY